MMLFFKWSLFSFGKKSRQHAEMGLIGTFNFFSKASSREEHESIHIGAEKGEFTFWLQLTLLQEKPGDGAIRRRPGLLGYSPVLLLFCCYSTTLHSSFVHSLRQLLVLPCAFTAIYILRTITLCFVTEMSQIP